METSFSLLQQKEKDVLLAIVKAKQISRTVLQKNSNLKMANFYNTVDSLYRYGLITKSASNVSGRKGRPSECLSINENAYYILYMFLSKSVFQIGVSNLSGELSDVETFQMTESFTADDFIRACVRYLESEKKIYNVAFAALVSGINLNSATVVGVDRSFLDTDFSNRLREALDLPFFQDTIAMAAALGIYNEKYTSKHVALLFCNLSTGIGIGMVHDDINEEFWYKPRANIEHWSMDPNGQMCSCGKRGCLVTTLGANSIVANAKQLIKQGKRTSLAGDFGIQDVIGAANNGDETARNVMKSAAVSLAHALENLYMVFHFNVAAIGGQVCSNNKYFFSVLEDLLSDSPYDIYMEQDYIDKASKGVSYRVLLELLK